MAEKNPPATLMPGDAAEPSHREREIRCREKDAETYARIAGSIERVCAALTTAVEAATKKIKEDK